MLSEVECNLTSTLIQNYTFYIRATCMYAHMGVSRRTQTLLHPTVVEDCPATYTPTYMHPRRPTRLQVR